jgi:hypothetical protein
MQKLVNVLAVASFVMSGAIIGAGVYVYTQKDALIDLAKQQVTEAISEMVADTVTGTITDSVSNFGITDEELEIESTLLVPTPSLPF